MKSWRGVELLGDFETVVSTRMGPDPQIKNIPHNNNGYIDENCLESPLIT
jgi:hypothetical protein